MINISEVINVSVGTPPAGLANQNVCNLLCMTKETPVVPSSDAYRIYTSSTDVAADWGSLSLTAKAAVSVFAQSPNIISGGGKFIVAPVGADETSEEALARLIPLVFFGGFATTFTETDEEILATAAAAQAAGKIFGVASSDDGDLETAGLLGELQASSLSYGRGLYHGDSAEVEGYKWGYLSRAMSVNFEASNTTNTMQLKQIAGSLPDYNLSATQLEKAKACGADVYAVIANRASVLSYGANEFFDEILNKSWLKMALEVAGFNALAQTNGKVPQTEAGVEVLKTAYRGIAEQAIRNGMVAPGTWTGSDTFGNPEDFHRNIRERGYFLYTAPVAEQSSADRAARKAPVCQLAIKLAGAIHSSSLIVNINK